MATKGTKPGYSNSSEPSIVNSQVTSACMLKADRCARISTKTLSVLTVPDRTTVRARDRQTGRVVVSLLREIEFQIASPSLLLGNTARNETKGDTADSIPFHSSLRAGAKSAPRHREESDSGGLKHGEGIQDSESSGMNTIGKANI